MEKKGLNQKFTSWKKNTCPWHFNHFICTLYRIPCLQYSMNSSSRKWNTLLTHIQFCWSGWPRRFGEINVSPHFYFFYCRLSRSQSLIRLFSPPLWSEYLFTLYLVKSGTEASCCYVWTETLYLVWIILINSTGARAIPHSVNIAFMSTTTTLHCTSRP